MSNELDAMAILPKRDFDASAKNWAVDENIGTIIVAPVRAVDGPELTVVMTLYLLTAIQLDDDMICIANSIFRRFVQLIQNIIQTARFQESSQEDRSSNNF